MNYAVRFDKHAVAEGCWLITRSGGEYSGNHLRLRLSRFLKFLPLFWPTASRRTHSRFGVSTRVCLSAILDCGTGEEPTALRNEDTALSYVLLEVQESFTLMGNFILETLQLPTPQDDLPALIVEGEVPELDTERQ